MKKLFLALCAIVVSTAAIAQITGTARPVSGTKFYAGDGRYNGVIVIDYSAPVGIKTLPDGGEDVVPPVAEITVGGQTVSVDAYMRTYNGTVWAVPVEDVLNPIVGTADAFTPFTIVVNDTATGAAPVNGAYEYNPVCPLLSIAPSNGTMLGGKDTTVVFTFNQSVTYSGVVVKSGNVTTTLAGGQGTAVAVHILPAYWGEATTSTNSLSIELQDVTTANGATYANVDSIQPTVAADYFCHDTPAVISFLGVDEDPYWVLAQDLFDTGVQYNFNAAPDYSAAQVVYEFYLGSTLVDTQTVSATQMSVGQNPFLGTPWLNVPAPTVNDDIYNDMTETWLFDRLEVTLTGIVAEGLVCPYTTEYATSFPDEESIDAREYKGTTSIASTSEQDVRFDVYTSQGTRIKKHASHNEVCNLGRGLYIINGHKVAIK